MSNTYEGGPITVNQTGLSITTSGVSASGTIPNDSAGNLPRYVRIAATAACYVRLGKTTATAVTTDLLIQPADAVILAVNGNDKAAAIQEAAAGKVIITPLENM